MNGELPKSRDKSWMRYLFIFLPISLLAFFGLTHIMMKVPINRELVTLLILSGYYPFILCLTFLIMGWDIRQKHDVLKPFKKLLRIKETKVRIPNIYEISLFYYMFSLTIVSLIFNLLLLTAFILVGNKT